MSDTKCGMKNCDMASPIPLQSGDLLGLLAVVMADALLVLPPIPHSNKLSEMPLASMKKGTAELSQPKTDSPYVIFSPPPPQVLTTALEKPPARCRGCTVAAHVQSSGNNPKGITKKSKRIPSSVFMWWQLY